MDSPASSRVSTPASSLVSSPEEQQPQAESHHHQLDLSRVVATTAARIKQEEEQDEELEEEEEDDQDPRSPDSEGSRSSASEAYSLDVSNNHNHHHQLDLFRDGPHSKRQSNSDESLTNNHHHSLEQTQIYNKHEGNSQQQQQQQQDSSSSSSANEHVKHVDLFGYKIVALTINERDRLCLAQISNTLLKDFSYNEIHNRRVALGITCVQCTPIQLELLRRAGAMPSSSRRCGMITMREAERLCRSFLAEEQPPELPENFHFSVAHRVNYGCKGRFVPARYISSRAKCIECFYCGEFYSPNKFIFHSHKQPFATDCNPPDSPNINSWRKHIDLDWTLEHSQEIKYAWEDVKSLFNGGTRRRMPGANHSSSIGASGANIHRQHAPSGGGGPSGSAAKHSPESAGETKTPQLSVSERRKMPIGWPQQQQLAHLQRQQQIAKSFASQQQEKTLQNHTSQQQQHQGNNNNNNNKQASGPNQYSSFPAQKRNFSTGNQQHTATKKAFHLSVNNNNNNNNLNTDIQSQTTKSQHGLAHSLRRATTVSLQQANNNLLPTHLTHLESSVLANNNNNIQLQQAQTMFNINNNDDHPIIVNRFQPQTTLATNNIASPCAVSQTQQQSAATGELVAANKLQAGSVLNYGLQHQHQPANLPAANFIYNQLYTQLIQSQQNQQQQQNHRPQQTNLSNLDTQLALRHQIWSSLLANLQSQQTTSPAANNPALGLLIQNASHQANPALAFNLLQAPTNAGTDQQQISASNPTICEQTSSSASSSLASSMQSFTGAINQFPLQIYSPQTESVFGNDPLIK